MADCRVCSAPIFWATTTVEGEPKRVPLDEHEMRDYGPERYRIVTNSVPPVVEAIDQKSPLRTYVDHRTLCQQPRAI